MGVFFLGDARALCGLDMLIRIYDDDICACAPASTATCIANRGYSDKTGLYAQLCEGCSDA